MENDIISPLFRAVNQKKHLTFSSALKWMFSDVLKWSQKPGCWNKHQVGSVIISLVEVSVPFVMSQSCDLQNCAIYCAGSDER